MAYISIQNVSKYYLINKRREVGQSFGELLKGVARKVKNIFNSGSMFREKKDIFYALKDISFNVEQGDIVGIVGKNGSGKSTLLKILSRITLPSSGRVSLGGKVTSLLEVGTGFHGELSGRENIFLNGIFLGMSRHEVRRKFSQIVDFAGVERFIDTPVKRYSSGMLLRLAFSVAAHLDPKILLIDEVLAVGDLEFQKKCLKVMDDLGSSGRTILFVSHNMEAVRRLCTKCAFLSSGKLFDFGKTDSVVEKYLLYGKENKSSIVWEEDNAPSCDLLFLKSVKVFDDKDVQKGSFTIHEPVNIEIVYKVNYSGNKISTVLHFFSADGVLLFVSLDTATTPWFDRPRGEGWYKSICRIPKDFFNDGEIVISVQFIHAETGRQLFYEDSVVAFHIADDMSKKGARGDFGHDWPKTVLRPVLLWNVDHQKRIR